MHAEPDLLIETLTFDTSNWPAGERFAVWTEHNRGSVFTQVEEGPFNASARLWLLDGIVVSEHWVDPFIGRRDRRLAVAAALDHIMLILPLEGTTRVKGSGVDVLCRRGDVAVLDYRRAMSTINSRQHGMAISVRRDLLESRCGPVDLHGRLPRSAETGILAGYVGSIVPHLPSTRQAATPALSRILYDLIAMALLSGRELAPNPVERLGLRQRVVRYVASIPPGELSLASLIADVGTTRATLYRAFRLDGGLLAYDRKRRLALVHRALVDKDPRSLTEIGASCGFSDPANLARHFQRRYGYTMTELRRVLATAAAHANCGDTVRTYREAVRSLTVK